MEHPLIDQLAEEWRILDELCASLTDDEWDRPTDLPGWTVRDNVAHIIGTERMLAGDPSPAATGAAGDHVRNPIGEANEAWVAHHRSWPGADVLAELRRVTASRLATLRAMTPEEWEREGFTPEGPGPFWKFVAIRVFDCWEHEQDIRRAVDRPGHLDGPIAEAAIDKVVAAAGYVVGKKAGAPEGTTVVFDVRGPIERVVPVVVEGRARTLAEVPADPTVRLVLDTEAYNALGCGRWSAQRALDEGRVTIEGDAVLGRRILDSMAFTI